MLDIRYRCINSKFSLSKDIFKKLKFWVIHFIVDIRDKMTYSQSIIAHEHVISSLGLDKVISLGYLLQGIQFAWR